ncbi:MAG: hypothetical protein KF861_06625 [Planctomycetaceae bacterium]|nr:hypothetical protein [Planctomycetaceae bacterium]
MVVIKVGGSLLSRPDLAVRLHGLFTKLQPARLLIVSGGGEAADIVRSWQGPHQLTDEQAHWLALRAVSLNEQLLSQILADAVVVASRDGMQDAWHVSRIPILASEKFLRQAESSSAISLPHDWSATSDSIAAWVAQQLGVQHLVLCKSCDLSGPMTLSAAAAQGLVDQQFPTCAAGLSILWTNLQADPSRIVAWHGAHSD